jgi:hypothetical protein
MQSRPVHVGERAEQQRGADDIRVAAGVIDGAAGTHGTAGFGAGDGESGCVPGDVSGKSVGVSDD